MRRINYEKLSDNDDYGKQESQFGQFKLPVVFKYTPNKERATQEVFLVGTFTSWKDKIAMAKNEGDFVAIVDLAEGEHQYKFVVDGNWEHDPSQVSCFLWSVWSSLSTRILNGGLLVILDFNR